MKITTGNILSRFKKVKESKSWNNDTRKELRMHKIHVYPAKFPSFIIGKSLQLAKQRGIKINTIGDIFCGCGTTALEAKRNNKIFWGCDINPVATLIAEVKRQKYDILVLQSHYKNVLVAFTTLETNPPAEILKNERINYWFAPNQITKLYNLLTAIERNIPNGKYREFFLVAFSNILKKTSCWLTKSIKPTRDLKKKQHDVLKCFEEQYKMMYKAADEVAKIITVEPDATIENRNFLKFKTDTPFVDMLITSPPYVTSYEYADLHQLSTLWLGYVKDYRELRKGTIGSVYHEFIDENRFNNLNKVALETYQALVKAKAKNPKSALKYFIDIKRAIEKSYTIINPGGMAVFVVGNTTHKKVYIDNAKYLTTCLLETGFNDIDVFKRRISSQISNPYRDKSGKFSKNKKHKQVYSYEYVVVAKKPDGK